VALLAALVVSLLLAVPGLRDVLDAIRHMSLGWVAAAIALEVASCVGFAVIFRYFFDRIPAVPAHLLAWTEMASGALLPGGGIGGLAVGGWLMRLAGMPGRRIVQRSVGLFFLTSATNVTAMTGAGLLLLAGVGSEPHDLLHGGLPILGAVAATTVVLVTGRRPGRAGRAHPSWGTDVVDGIHDAEQALLRPSWRLLGAVGYLGFDIAVLWASFEAMGHPLPVPALVLGYLIGYLANLLPIPGGVGILDAGLAGTLVLYGAPATQAAAAVLVYHAIAVWIPGLGGVISYAVLRRRLMRRRTKVAAQPAGAIAPDLAARNGSAGLDVVGPSPAPALLLEDSPPLHEVRTCLG
jgi:uncharacterized membrane protein YbhN (UPF0104 family)